MRPQPIHKTCPYCKEYNEFRAYSSGSGYGFRSYCHECYKAKQRKRDRRTYAKNYYRNGHSRHIATGNPPGRPAKQDYTAMNRAIEAYIRANEPCTRVEISDALGIDNKYISGRLMAIETGGTLLYYDGLYIGIFKLMSLDECMEAV